MENHVLQQLQLLGLSALLGAAGAAFYDMLRSIRLRRRQNRTLTYLLDGLYVALALLVLSVFALRLGGGQLRLYMLLGTMLGAGLYFLLPASFLRPLWDSWTDVAAEVLRLLWLPPAFLLGLVKNLCKTAKRGFLFLRKYAKIKNYRWEFAQLYRRADGKGGRKHREKGKKDRAETQFHHHAGVDGSVGGDGH